MATTPTKPGIEVTPRLPDIGAPAWPREKDRASATSFVSSDSIHRKPSGRDALQALLAFSALHEQVRRRRALAGRQSGFEVIALQEFEEQEQFVLDEVLQLVAERAVAITGADGLAIALAEHNEIVLRASAGTIKPDVGARIDRASAFSGASFRMAQVFRCDDTELDSRVNLRACRELGARSMVAVPLCGRRRVIGLLEAFSSEPFGFNDSDVRNLTLLAELVLGALKPEDEERFAESAQVAATELVEIASVDEESPSDTLVAQVVASVAPAVSAAVAHAAPAKAAEKPAVASALITAPEVAAPEAARLEVAKPEAKEPKVAVSEVPVFEVTNKAELDLALDKALHAVPTLGQLPNNNRPGVLLVLVLVVIASVLAGGLWWRLKNAQLGNAIVQSREPAIKPADTTSTELKSPTPGLPQTSPVSNPNSNPNISTNKDANTTPDSLSTTAEPATSAATPQELSKFPRVTGIRHWSSVDSTTIVLDLEDQVQYEAHRISNPDRIYFDLRDTALATELAGKTVDVGDPLVSRIRVAQPVSGMTRVVLETKGNSNFSVSLEPNPYRLVVQVRKIGANPKGAVNLFPNEVEAEMNKLAIVVPPPTREDLQLRARVPKMRIVVDAGHGGWDLGTVGRRGLLEKDLVLEVARRLGKLLETRLGSDVIYTRQDDNYIPLDERAGIANQAQADLFISVHANYSDLPSARGVETYYTNFFSAPDVKNVETRDSTSGSTAVSASLKPAELHEKIEQSRRLAASVQRSLYGTLSAQNPGLRDRGVKAAGFVVLTETAMPGILAEVSFVSSPTDEQRLRSDGYREQIAEALYKGIARYAANSRGVKMASVAK
jgi:N-acetylmuramoyl-L-alanine amidase/putative methionine-R-sulfoxide reductase with GAF domain